MARLIDDLRAAGQVRMPWHVAPSQQAEWASHVRQVMSVVMVPSLPVVLIDNVADYYYTGTDQEHWDLRKHFPNVAPPYPMAWFEHRMARRCRSSEYGEVTMDGSIGKDARMGILVCGADRASVTGDDIPENLHWLLCLEIFIDYGIRGREIEGPPGTWYLGIDKEGQLIDVPFARLYCEKEEQDALRLYQSLFHPTLLAISFMHCKNVHVEDNTVSVPLAKKYASRHNGIKPTGYKTLVIEPLKQILRHQGGAHQHGLAHAMHICRGHFRDYREGRGLFGKYNQLVWTPATVRGTKGEKEAPPREMKIKV